MSRLPTVGGDSGAWGSILNDFLSVWHQADGMIKPAKMIYVDAKGAVGDGTTDDTSAIHAARDAAGAGGVVVFSPGTTYATNGVTANVADQTWVMYGATLKLKNGANNTLLNSSGSNFAILRGTLDGNKANQTSGVITGIVCSGAHPQVVYTTIKNSYGPGLQCLSGATDFVLDHPYLTGCGHALIGDGTGSAIMLTGTSYGEALHPVVDTPAEHGLFVYNGTQNRRMQLTDVVVRTAGGIGIALDGGGTSSRASEIAITNPLITGCHDNGIDTGQAQWVTVNGGVVDGCNMGFATDTGGTALFNYGEVKIVVVGLQCKNSTNSNSSVAGNTGHGFAVLGGTQLIGCRSENNWGDGFALAAGRATSDNTQQQTSFDTCWAINNGTGTNGNAFQAGFAIVPIVSFPIYRISLVNCHAFESGGTTQLYGLQLTTLGAAGALADEIQVIGCNFQLNQTAAYNRNANVTAPSDSVVSGNLPTTFTTLT